jgi:RNA polymerase sigma-70 factor (ECF subfamily)
VSTVTGRSTAELYSKLRPLLFSIAYRMLGSVGDAEDVVQDSILRLHRAVDSGTEVGNPKAYLTTTASRLSLDALRSARRRRESYVGEWLPEPLLADALPGERAEMSESLSLAFLVVLESLNPVERAVFLLRDVFGYEFDELGEMIERRPEHCRQILVRARAKVAERRPRYAVDAARRIALAQRFFAACEHGDLAALKRLLAADVQWHGDGGGKAPAVARAVVGADRVLRLLVGLLAQAQRLGIRLEPATVNGRPGALTRTADGKLVSVLALESRNDTVAAVHGVLNPDKLDHLGETVDVRVLHVSMRRGAGLQ